MHLSSHRNVRRCLKSHLLTDPILNSKNPIEVLDVGGADMNGSYRDIFNKLSAHYTASDLILSPNVDVVQDKSGSLPFADKSFDIVISGQTFEHCWNFWNLFSEMVRVCRSEGLIFVIAPSEGPEHRFPIDCYRFLPDSFDSLATKEGIILVDSWKDSVGPFCDLVGVFRIKPLTIDEIAPNLQKWRKLDEPSQNFFPTEMNPNVDFGSGSLPLTTLLTKIHELFEPRLYLEIGVSMGRSFRLSSCSSIGVDPYPDLKFKLTETHRIIEMTSEDFFTYKDISSLLKPLDFAFIDGLHLIENVLMDFMNIELYSNPGTIVVIDDIFPNHPIQAARNRSSRFWTGDVWKIIPILKHQRPDLILLPIDTDPTGCLIIIGLDSSNTKLWKIFDYLMIYEMNQREPNNDVLMRVGAFSPEDRLIVRLLKEVKKHRLSKDQNINFQFLKEIYNQAMPRKLVDI